jgi:hypothetical protein
MTELCESLVARSTFLVVSLVKGIKKFGLLLGCESHSDLIIPSEDGHDRSLWQRVLYDNLAANYGSRSDLHVEMVLHYQ